MKKISKIITACSACVVAAGLCGTVIYLNTRDNGSPTSNNVQVLTEAPTEAFATPDKISDAYGYSPSTEGMTDKAKKLINENSDYIGWITIDNTKVDNPILLDPGDINPGEGYGDEIYEPNYFYLDHDFNRDPFRAGALFMDYRDIFGSDDDKQSENIVIYGHNMANNTMFGSLRRYRQDLSFYDEAPFIDLSSNYKDYQYVIFGLMITSGNWYTDFRYWDMEELDTETDFNNYVDTVKKGSMVDTGVDVKYGDKLLTLSTCYSDEDNSRFLVVARRLRDNEKPNDISSIDRTEEYIKKQQEESKAAESESSEITSQNDSNEADAQ